MWADAGRTCVWRRQHTLLRPSLWARWMSVPRPHCADVWCTSHRRPGCVLCFLINELIALVPVSVRDLAASSLCFLALRVLVSPLGHPGQPRLPFCRWVGKCFRQFGDVQVSLTLPRYLQRLAVRLNIHYLF